MTQDAGNVDTILFLGAGASQFAGYHTFRRFGELITDPAVRLSEGLPHQSDETPRLIESLNQALRDMHRPTTHDNYLWLLTDYHTFCGKFDTHSGLQTRFPRIRDEIHAFDSTTVTVINDLTQTTYCHYSRQRDLGPIGQEVRSLYEELAISNSSAEPFLPVFTTNYDLLLEDLFNGKRDSSVAVPLINGITSRTRKGAKWSPSLYEKSGVHLYRLHGCVGWFRASDDPSTTVLFERPASLDGDMLSRLCVMFPGRELQLGNDPHGYGFRRLYSYLLRCKRAVFIGFSFRDDDVMQILLAANAARKQPLFIRIIDPTITCGDVIENLRGASLRSPFMAAVPSSDTIECLRMDFGVTGCKQKVIEFLD
jgi:SIR2-like domain